MKLYRINKLAKRGGMIVEKKDVLAASDGEAVSKAADSPDCPVCDVLHDGEIVALESSEPFARVRRARRLRPSSKLAPAGLIGEIFVDRRDDLGAVADRGRDPLDRGRANVADREHAAAAGFQRQAAVAGLLAVSRKPRGSRSRPDAASQSVLGSAPMNENR